jgi:FemAB-related protein (PEP-CTERM system-associated)
MKIKILERDEENQWDDFVLKQSNSTIFQLSCWKTIIKRTYNHDSFYLIAHEDEEVKGILPLISIKDRILGRKLISMPFTPYGGVCTTSAIAAKRLIEEAKNITDREGIGYLELRNCSKDLNACGTNTTFVTSILELMPDPERLFKKLSNKKRNTIRKCIKEDLNAIWTNDLKDFYHLYLENMKYHGTPAHSYQFFENISVLLRENTKILSIQLDGKTICSFLFLTYRDVIIDLAHSTIRQYKKYNPTTLGLWTAMQYACDKEYRYFDFGRSINGSPNYEFKRKWGT